MNQMIIRKAAVLGAGVMGARIAAHLANAGIETLLFDLPLPGGDPNGVALQAIAGLTKHKPAPLALASYAERITALNYDTDLKALETCDLVIEAIVEQMQWKIDLYRKVGPYLARHAIFATNTSGLSVQALADECPALLRTRFCGIHFFNPPRYMPLVELIASRDTDAALINQLETFLVSRLGKCVIRARDTPNFIANRIGMFSMLTVIHHAAKYNIRFDVVDDLTGVRLGRPKSATFRTADVVGLDTFMHVLKTMQDSLPDDPWHAFFSAPLWLQQCVKSGALGAKSKQGIYKKEGEARYVLDPHSQTYVPADQGGSDEVKAILKNPDIGARFAALRASTHPEAQFLWAAFRDMWHYLAYHLPLIADNARDIDFAMRWGYGWKEGPFEIWQAAGWQAIADAINEDIREGRSLVSQALPLWVASHTGVHCSAGSYSAGRDTWVARSSLPVYRRQLFPPRLIGEGEVIYGETLYENDGLRMWTTGDAISIVSFKTKLNCIGDSVLKGLDAAITLAEKAGHKGLILWQPDGPFSVGADLLSMGPAFMTGDWDTIENMVALFQQTSLRIRYSPVPVVAAVQGYALGGGCELLMHTDRVVACLESYIGLVEVGVGLLPAGGGCKEFALRAAQRSTGDLFAALKDYYMTIATAKVATSAREAQQIGYLRPADVIILHPDELLHVAKTQVNALHEAGYQPPFAPKGFAVAGRTGAATIRGQLLNMREGSFISGYDYFVAEQIADVITGGDVEAGTLVDEPWILALERQGFMRLLKKGKTQERIMFMLENNKPLRN